MFLSGIVAKRWALPEPDLSRIVAYQTNANSGAGVRLQTDDQPDSGHSIENIDCYRPVIATIR